MNTRLSDPDFAFVRDLVARRSAIVVERSKEYLIHNRLPRVAEEAGLAGLGQLLDRVRAGDEELTRRLVEALTTNETSWFRDSHPFVALQERILPGLIERRRATRKLAIWSAACSTGQELYTIAMIVDSFRELADWRVTLLGTDINRTVVAQARDGRYSTLEVGRGLSAQHQRKYLLPDSDGCSRISPALRSAVQFRTHNLLEPLRTADAFDVVLLRNVLIYFDNAARAKVLTSVRRVMNPDGVLLLGTAETTNDVPGVFVRQHHEGSSVFVPHADAEPAPGPRRDVPPPRTSQTPGVRPSRSS